jgi:hypothetical protein
LTNKVDGRIAMATVKDEVYDTVYRISQGDFNLLEEKTNDFLQSVVDAYSSIQKSEEHQKEKKKKKKKDISSSGPGN